ncbi:luciferin sulfotransferase-like [Topomyia yanbarensis]|uniref:luciferin sulfotransferase-like n=1 Tax=Topomyia yanbarensis TaxID=2498891 RepID=UPI00273B9E29|nr:luciferin sulfotransferase-like [Topomyia yanbarensis]
MFSFKSLDSDLAKSLSCPGAPTFIEVQLEDLTESPFTDGESWNPTACVLPAKYQQFADKVRNFEVYEDDVWIITFPKCGTTWTQEMVWLVDHDLDYSTAKRVNLNRRSVYLEIGCIAHNLPVDSLANAANLPRPRHIKSHLPLALLPKQLWTVKPKLVYVSRNPKDVAVSYLHHYQMIMGYRGSKENFLEGLLTDKIVYCPQISHALDFWRLHNEQNVLFLTYEQMKRDLRTVLERVCGFFGKQYTNEQLDELVYHLSFDQMKKNPATNNVDMVAGAMQMNGRAGEKFKFMRKGEIGDHKTELSAETIANFDKFIERELIGSDFRFDQ